MTVLGSMVRNSVGLILTLFVVRLIDSLSTVIFNGERLSSKIAAMLSGNGGSA